MAALDKQSGEIIWTSPEIKEAAGNCSPVIGRIGEIDQIITLSASSVLSFDLSNGNLLWQYPFGNSRENNIADAIISNGLVYASSGYGKGSILLRPERQQDGKFNVKPVWMSSLLDNHHY